jgi:hypothetical protein
MSASRKGVLHSAAIPRSENGQLRWAGAWVPLDQSRQESRWKRHLGRIADSAGTRNSAAFDMSLGR